MIYTFAGNDENDPTGSQVGYLTGFEQGLFSDSQLIN